MMELTLAGLVSIDKKEPAVLAIPPYIYLPRLNEVERLYIEKLMNLVKSLHTGHGRVTGSVFGLLAEIFPHHSLDLTLLCSGTEYNALVSAGRIRTVFLEDIHKGSVTEGCVSRDSILSSKSETVVSISPSVPGAKPLNVGVVRDSRRLHRILERERSDRHPLLLAKTPQ